MADNRVAKNYYVMEKPDYCIIAAFTKNKQLVMVEQYRHPVGHVDIEFPAGFINKNESKFSAARRELLEETGYKVKKMKYIGEFYASPGILTNKAHIFIGYGAVKIAEQKLDRNEQIDIKLLNISEALDLSKEGKIKDLGTNFVLELLKNL